MAVLKATQKGGYIITENGDRIIDENGNPFIYAVSTLILKCNGKILVKNSNNNLG